MGQPFFPGGHLLLVHEVMVKEEMQRNNPRHHRYLPDGPHPGFTGGLRRGIARGLIAIGTRLDPSAPTVGRPAPVANN
jgi:hypothetical protein